MSYESSTNDVMHLEGEGGKAFMMICDGGGDKEWGGGGR